MMSLGDIKPASLREIETLIWRNLYLVARCQLSAEEMMHRVLDTIVDAPILISGNKDELNTFFANKFGSIENHTGFFFPGNVNSLCMLPMY